MKNIFITLFSLSILLFSSCEDEDNLVFQIDNDTENLIFTNDLLAEYMISESFADNIAERLTWEDANFGAPVNVNYELSAGIEADLSDGGIIGTTSRTNLAVSVEQLLTFASQLGLDSDPTTTNEDGTPNNTGIVYFQLTAMAGEGNSEDAVITSEIISLNIKVMEESVEGAACDGLYILGDGAPDAGWNWGTALQMGCEEDVLTIRLNLANNNFRFFETDGDWASGLGYYYFADAGYEIDTNFEAADDADDNFYFAGTPGLYELVIDQNNLTITLSATGSYYLVGDGTQAGWAWDNRVVLEQNSPYIYSGSVDLNPDGAFRVFSEDGNWDSGLNFPYYEGEGYTIDERFINAEDGDSNFKFTGTAGTFTMIVNEVEKTITLE